MALSREYSEAAVDVLDILNHMDWRDFSRVPTSFIEFLEENSAQDYEANLDYSKEITEMELSKEAIGILGVMYRQFWCPEEKKEAYDQRMVENEIEFQKELKKNHTSEELYEKAAIVIDDEGHAMQDNQQLVVVDRAEGFLDKLFEKIGAFFKKIFGNKEE